MIKKTITAIVAITVFTGFGMASPARALVDPVSIAVGLTIAFTSMVTVSEVKQDSDGSKVAVENADSTERPEGNNSPADSEIPVDSTVYNFN